MTTPSVHFQPLRIGWLCGLAFCASLALVFWPDSLSFNMDKTEGLASFSAGLPWWQTGGVLFLGGLLTALTPCVYPLIPITVGVLGASQARSKLQAIALSAAYVVGIGLIFSLAGLGAALSGQVFGTLLSSRWVQLGLFLLMAALAASMLGAFELRLPYAWTQRLGRLGGGGSLGGALLMGGAAGVLAAPCTGPVLSGLLLYIGERQAVVLGGLGLFVYAMGIGLPFFLVGVFALKLPKGGKWMMGVKYFLGLLLAVFALGYLKGAWPAFDSTVVWLAHSLGGRTVGLLVTGGMVFFALLWGGLRRNAEKAQEAQEAQSPLREKRLQESSYKMPVLAMVLLAILLRFELPSAAVLPGAPFVWDYRFSAKESAFVFDEVLQKAKAEGQPVLIDFFAQWCAACRELDKITLVDARVVQEAERFVRIKVDGTLESKQIEALYARFSVRGLPTVVFVDAQGTVLSKPRVEGFVGPRELLRRMRQVP